MGDVRREADRCQVGPSGPTGPKGSGVSERDTARAALVSASRAGAKTDRRSAGPARPRRKQSKASRRGEEERRGKLAVGWKRAEGGKGPTTSRGSRLILPLAGPILNLDHGRPASFYGYCSPVPLLLFPSAWLSRFFFGLYKCIYKDIWR